MSSAILPFLYAGIPILLIVIVAAVVQRHRKHRRAAAEREAAMLAELRMTLATRKPPPTAPRGVAPLPEPGVIPLPDPGVLPLPEPESSPSPGPKPAPARSGTPPARAAGSPPRFLEPPLARLFLTLRAALPEHHVFARTPVTHILPSDALLLAHGRFVCDCVVCNRSMEVIAIVHADVTAPAQGIDAHVEAFGIRWIRVSAAALPRPAELARQILGAPAPGSVASFPSPDPALPAFSRPR